MAAPPVTNRTVPTGYKLPEGFKIAVAFSLRPAISIFEVEGAPAGFSATKIETTTQQATKWASFWMSAILDPQDVGGNAGYDPDEMDNLIFLCGAQSGSWTISMPQNTKYAYWGGLLSVQFQALKAKQFPMLSYVNCVTNYDTANRVEAGPSMTAAAGTGV